MTAHKDLEQILSYFINLIEKDELYEKRQSILYPENEGTNFRLDEKTETVTYIGYYDPQDGGFEMPEYPVKQVFPEILKNEIDSEKSYFFNKVINQLEFLPLKQQDECLLYLSQRLNKIIAATNTNKLVEKYSFITEALTEIKSFLETDYINHLPASERLYSKVNKTTTALLFTLLGDAGIFLKHSDADIAKFLDARISYFNEEEKKYSSMVDSAKLISKIRKQENNYEEPLNELKKLLNNTSLRINE